MSKRARTPKGQSQVETGRSRPPEPSASHQQGGDTVSRAWLEASTRSVLGVSDHVADSALEIPQGNGSPLDPITRSRMERLFARSFEDVRIHNGPAAARAARSLDAKAYTIGADIVFGAGRHAPATPHGDRLLAHELAHVTQQRHTPPSASPAIGEPDAPAEREAERAATDVAAGRITHVQAGTVPVVVRRAPAEGAEDNRGWWEKSKTWFYDQAIKGMRTAQSEWMKLLRSQVPRLDPALQPYANGFLEIYEIMGDISISFVLAVIGLLSGLGHGIVSAIWGLIKLVAGIFEWLIRWFLSFFSDRLRQEYSDWVEGVWGKIKSIPRGLQVAYDNKKKEFETASPDQMSILIGELTGEVIAILATIAVGGGLADKAPRLAVTLGEGGELAFATATTGGKVASGVGGAATLTVDVAGHGTGLGLTAAQMSRIPDEAEGTGSSGEGGGGSTTTTSETSAHTARAEELKKIEEFVAQKTAKGETVKVPERPQPLDPEFSSDLAEAGEFVKKFESPPPPPGTLKALSKQGIASHEALDIVVIPTLQKRMPPNSCFSAQNYAQLETTLGIKKVPWQRSDGPDLLLVDASSKRVVVMDMARSPSATHIASKQKQALDLQRALGKKWKVEYGGDFHPKPPITTDSILKEIESKLKEFGFE